MSKTVNTEFNPSLIFKVELVVTDFMQYFTQWEGKQKKKGH